MEMNDNRGRASATGKGRALPTWINAGAQLHSQQDRKFTITTPNVTENEKNEIQTV